MSVCMSVCLLFVNKYKCTCVQDTWTFTGAGIGRPKDDSREKDLDRSPPVNIPLEKKLISYFCDFKGSIIYIFVVITYYYISPSAKWRVEIKMDRNSKEYSVLQLGEFMKVEDRNLSYIMFSEVQLTANRGRHRVSTFQSRAG